MEVTYTAERDGQTITGKRGYIAAAIGVCDDYVANLARTGTQTKDGWIVRRSNTSPIWKRPDRIGVQYIAIHRVDDPMLGTAEELAPLLGTSVTTIRNVIRSNKLWHGWTIRIATEDEIERMESQWQ